MDFPFGTTVIRQRRKVVTDPYSQKQVAGNWDDPDAAEIENAWVASSSSSAVPDAIRSQVTTTKSLYCPPDADVKVGDRIVAGGVTYQVNAKPDADVNPFSGWQPAAEILLKEVSG
jgi:hypothetical protein